MNIIDKIIASGNEDFIDLVIGIYKNADTLKAMNILNLPIREKLEIILDVIKWNKGYCGRKWTFVNETHNRDNTKFIIISVTNVAK